MKLILLQITIVSLLPVFLSCSGSDSSKTGTSLKKGEYAFIISDSLGKTLADGIMKFDKITSDKSVSQFTHIVSGSYTVRRYVDDNDTNFIGISTLNGGALTAQYNEKNLTIFINTNPMIADANVFINATLNKADNSLSGVWNFSAFRNVRKNEGGIFAASRIK